MLCGLLFAVQEAWGSSLRSGVMAYRLLLASEPPKSTKTIIPSLPSTGSICFLFFGFIFFFIFFGGGGG